MDVNTPEEGKELLINPQHPCQTPHRSFSRHYWVAVWESRTDATLGVLTNRRRCTTCGVTEEATPYEGQ